jgi:beta-glucosidase-like glycosyl hydrolase
MAMDGHRFRDLDHDGTMAPYEDSRLSASERTDDLLARLSLAEKAGLMFHTVIEAGADGSLLEAPGMISKSPASTVVLGKLMNHFNVHRLSDARSAAMWANALQGLAAQTAHGIPVTISSDPRHAFTENVGVSFAGGMMSTWPEPLGLAALHDPDAVRRFAEVVNAEYRAVGIRMALHPQLDLGTEPRWGRRLQTFGSDPVLVTACGRAYLAGLQGERLGPASVAAISKHFPGGGSLRGGEDAHFPYGSEQVYSGHFAEHLAPFRAAVELGTAGMMPYYSKPVGLELDGEAVEEVGFGYNRQIVTGLLRDRLGYAGIVLSDWELIYDNYVGGQVLPARAWGVEHLTPPERLLKLLDAGIDQFGGEECVDLLLDLVASGRVGETRLDASARRILLVKFELGLFDDPFVDVDAAASLVASDVFVAEGRRAQSESVCVLADADVLPLPAGIRVYSEGLSEEALARFTVVSRPEDADVAIVRIGAPFEPRNDLFLESWFHQGSLEFPPGLPVRLRRIAAACPLVLDVFLDRGAILTPLLGIATVLTASWGTSGAAYVDAVTGVAWPRGRLPFDLPRSRAQVLAHPEDAPRIDDPLFALGHWLGDTRGG